MPKRLWQYEDMPTPPESESEFYSADNYEENLNRAPSAFPSHLIVSDSPESQTQISVTGERSDAPQDGNIGYEDEPEELNDVDKLDKETAWHHLANPNKPLTPRHWELCRLLAMGLPHWEIHEKMGYGRNWISELSAHPKIRREVERMQGVVFERTIEDRFKQMNHRAMDVIEEVITGEDTDVKERLKAATWLLEKTTGKAKQEIETKGGTLTDFMTLLRQVSQERQALQASAAAERSSTQETFIDITPAAQEDDGLSKWVDQNL